MPIMMDWFPDSADALVVDSALMNALDDAVPEQWHAPDRAGDCDEAGLAQDSWNARRLTLLSSQHIFRLGSPSHSPSHIRPVVMSPSSTGT